MSHRPGLHRPTAAGLLLPFPERAFDLSAALPTFLTAFLTAALDRPVLRPS
jgi:hypothetical protein